MRGQMLWFNEAKDYGFIMTDEGERLAVAGEGFAKGEKPEGRCAHKVVTFEVDETGRAAGAERRLRAGYGRVATREDAERRARNSTLGGPGWRRRSGSRPSTSATASARSRRSERSSGRRSKRSARRSRTARSSSRTGSGRRTSSSTRRAPRRPPPRRPAKRRPAKRRRLRCRPGPSSWKHARRTGSTRRATGYRGWGSTTASLGR